MHIKGRSGELAKLEAACLSDGFRLVVLCGRRGVGKTTLLHEFCRGKNSIFYTAKETKLESNLSSFSRLVYEKNGPKELSELWDSSSFQNLQSLLSVAASSESKEKLILVIDEFQYLQASDPSVLPTLQGAINFELSHKNILLILCGKNEPMMELADKKSRLADKISEIIEVKPFNYLTAAEFTPAYTEEDKILAYGVTGGVARYLSLFDPNISAWENISRLYFTPTGALYEEAQNILRAEFRNIMLYNTLLEAISGGCRRMNEISEKTGYGTPVISPAVKKLISGGIIKKEPPLLNEESKRDAEYRMADPSLEFFYRFVFSGRTFIETGNGYDYMTGEVKNKANEYLTDAFSDTCRQYTGLRGLRGDFFDEIKAVGRWKGDDPIRKEKASIDVVCVSKTGDKAVIGDCKFKNSGMDQLEIDRLFEKGRLLRVNTERHLLFSKGGFYPSVLRKYREDKSVELLTLKDIYILKA